MRHYQSIVLSCLLLSSCATSYQSKGFTGGFSETQLAPDTVQIRFRGNGYTKRERTNDFALLRAAELCLNSSCKYFKVLGGETSTDSYTHVTSGGPSYTSGTLTNYGYGNYGYSGYTNHSSPTVTTFKRHESVITVKFFRSKPSGGAYDANFISQSIRSKYGM